jgi:hypothetical protein
MEQSGIFEAKDSIVCCSLLFAVEFLSPVENSRDGHNKQSHSEELYAEVGILSDKIIY